MDRDVFDRLEIIVGNTDSTTVLPLQRTGKLHGKQPAPEINSTVLEVVLVKALTMHHTLRVGAYERGETDVKNLHGNAKSISRCLLFSCSRKSVAFDGEITQLYLEMNIK
ncbi:MULTISPECIES: hypothetical protein [unclassified Pseudomonas]|uniref:hypothetical protein n=1 Tax=unclassified Pseudomonas TaxID=196821 RepID=UPI002AC91EBA|nr:MULTISPECIES: hypothetical protein [unclassified Pseudomonas]MEB0045200.1 hypothetical protein [Pseudomonas sp. Dout3]MEB0096444.1 hypothetical protein [Pseudomonas sp. DC1.2]WPX61701.1 hypothetical protein RHM68_12410 [Pseudomonas sp. DC1.2]